MKIHERITAFILILAMSIFFSSCAAEESAEPAASPAPTAAPESTPEAVVEDIKLMFYTTELDEFTLREGETVQLHAEIDGVSEAQFEWKSSDESSLTIEHRFEDTQDAWLTAVKAVKGGVTLTLSCAGFEKEFKVYIHPGQ